ncbi:AI-2E family transporter [Robbsia sp. KACC 23696]|uniref:AI-2E family transporter n=1 Tax=Robbsia sp. KACC 23696 TaxID=3149231 RepID=UPI00325B8FF7
MQKPKSVSTLFERSVYAIAFVVIVASLHFAAEVLIPVTLSIILSFLIMPLVARLRRAGFGHNLSITLAVLIAVVVAGFIGILIASRVIQLASDAPLYAVVLHEKILALSNFANVGTNWFSERFRSVFDYGTLNSSNGAATGGAVPKFLDGASLPGNDPRFLLQWLIRFAWPILSSTGVVLAVLVFVLFEHEALRDRFIRVTGTRDIRATTVAVNEAGQRLSHYFVSQLIINACVGLTIAIALWIADLSGALLFGILAFVFRYVPYVGVLIAAAAAAFMGMISSDGWTLALTVVVIFVSVELVFSQFIEPLFYGHSTGLSPLSVVLSAIVWAWLWGPVGLVLSTPLTLCLVVFARHFESLRIFEILLADLPALSLSERFYQRALSNDAIEISRDARSYIRKRSLVAYCDKVLIPALMLAKADVDRGTIGEAERSAVGNSILVVLEDITADSKRRRRRLPKVSLADGASLGQILRSRREAVLGKMQGPISGPPRSLILVVPAHALYDSLMAEILVRVLRARDLDARHITPEEFMSPPPNANPALVGACFLVYSPADADTDSHAEGLTNTIAARLPHAARAAVRIADPFAEDSKPAQAEASEKLLVSFSEALEFALQNTTVDAPRQTA